VEFFSLSRVRIIFSAAQLSKAREFPPFLTSPKSHSKARQRPCQWMGVVLCLAPRGILFFLKRLSQLYCSQKIKTKQNPKFLRQLKIQKTEIYF
jgi:hypothetical protein